MTDNLKKYLLFGGIGVVAILLAVWIFSPGEDARFGNETKEQRAERMARTGDPTSSGMDFGMDRDSGMGDSYVTDDGVGPNQLLETYQEWAQYPPYSRPMSVLNHDLAFPFIVESSPDILFDKVGDTEPNGYLCLFQPRTWAVIGQEDLMHITLECRDEARKRVKVSIDKTQVFREFDGKRYGAVSADVSDNGQNGDETAGDNIFTFQWKPMKSDWGEMSLEADITYGPGKKTTVTASFFSSPNLPAKYSGIFTERVDEGSLKVRAVLEVYKKGNYHLEANLKDKKNGEYIAYATFDGDLNSGTQEVDFIFFGKILRDKGLDGPYIVTDFRGHRVNLPINPDWFNQGEEGLKKIQAAKSTEPDKELVYPYKDGFETRFFDVDNFSKAEWSSQEKVDRIRDLQEAVNEKN